MIRFSIIFLFAMVQFANAYEYYLVKWQWLDPVNDPHWDVPGAVGWMDLRSYPQRTDPDRENPKGYAFAWYNEPISQENSLYLGNNLNNDIDGMTRFSMEWLLNISTPIASSKLVDVIWDVTTIYADPSDQLRSKPKTPTNDMLLVMSLNGHSIVKQKKLTQDSAEWNNVVSVYQEDYRKLRDWSKKGLIEKDGHKRWLDQTEEQFKVSYRTFIPSDLPDEGKLPHKTSYSEDFNCTNADELDCDLGWTEVSNDLDIVTNSEVAAITLNNGSRARMDSSLATSNMGSSITVTAATRGSGARAYFETAVRFSASEVTAYMLRLEDQNTDPASALKIRKVEAGTESQLATVSTVTFTLPDTIYLSVNGDNIICLFNGAENFNFTDTSITGNVQAGIGGRPGSGGSGTGNGDDFFVDDLAGAAAGGLVFQAVPRRRGWVGRVVR